MARLAAAAGCDLVVKLYPAEGIRLRDSGQLAVARLIARRVGSPWRSRFEVPVGRPPDRRAGDVVLDQPAEMVLVEIETGLLDFQSQYRAAQLKRTSLGERVGRPIRLVLALFDTERNRRAVHMHHEVLLQALPVPSRRVWTALRAGLPIAGDGILWVSPRDLK